jgi:hypothetical protein
LDGIISDFKSDKFWGNLIIAEHSGIDTFRIRSGFPFLGGLLLAMREKGLVATGHTMISRLFGRTIYGELLTRHPHEEKPNFQLELSICHGQAAKPC